MNPANQRIGKEEAQKRQVVLIKDRKIVLIKILAMRPMGLPVKSRNEVAIDQKHAEEAEKRNLNFTAYRSKGDTGDCLFEKEAGVRISDLISQLKALDMRCVEAHTQFNKKKGPVSTLTFSTEGDKIQLPAKVIAALKLRFNNCTVWCNLKYAENGNQFRLDTINLAKGRITDEPARELVITGNTYQLQ